MNNQQYIHFLELLKKEDQEKKWIKFAILAIICTSSLAILYGLNNKRIKLLNDKILKENEDLNKSLSILETELENSHHTLASYKEENTRLHNENSILGYKLKTLENKSIPQA